MRVMFCVQRPVLAPVARMLSARTSQSAHACVGIRTWPAPAAFTFEQQRQLAHLLA